MGPRYFDPMGRECDYAAFCEWCDDRPDLKIVRHFLNDEVEVKLVWNDRPINTFEEPDVFKMEVIKKIDGRRAINTELSALFASRLSDAVAMYQEVLVALGVATKTAEGLVIEDEDNQAEPTTHELEFTVEELEYEEAVSETGVELEEPKISKIVAVIEEPKVAKVGEGFAGMADGADAW